MDQYEQQAIDFLIKTRTNCKVDYTHSAPAAMKGRKQVLVDHYTVVLERGSQTLKYEFVDSIYNSVMRKVAAVRGRFDSADELYGIMWRMDRNMAVDLSETPTSIASLRFKKKWRNYKPTSYDVLSGLYILHCETFDEFCGEFGYNEGPLSEYPRVMGIYTELQRISTGLRRMYSEEELQELSDIN